MFTNVTINYSTHVYSYMHLNLISEIACSFNWWYTKGKFIRVFPSSTRHGARGTHRVEWANSHCLIHTCTRHAARTKVEIISTFTAILCACRVLRAAFCALRASCCELRVEIWIGLQSSTHRIIVKVELYYYTRIIGVWSSKKTRGTCFSPKF